MGAKEGHVVSPETRAKIRAALTGRKLTPEQKAARPKRTLSAEHRAAIARAVRKHDPVCSIEGCGKKHLSRGWCPMHYYRWQQHGDPTTVLSKPTAAASPRWQGEDVGYDAVHLRARGLPKVCAACHTADARMEIALKHDAATENIRMHLDRRSGREIPFSVGPNDYVRLCITCHRRYDSPKESTRQPIIEALAGNGAKIDL